MRIAAGREPIVAPGRRTVAAPSPVQLNTAFRERRIAGDRESRTSILPPRSGCPADMAEVAAVRHTSSRRNHSVERNGYHVSTCRANDACMDLTPAASSSIGRIASATPIFVADHDLPTAPAIIGSRQRYCRRLRRDASSVVQVAPFRSDRLRFSMSVSRRKRLGVDRDRKPASCTSRVVDRPSAPAPITATGPLCAGDRAAGRRLRELPQLKVIARAVWP